MFRFPMLPIVFFSAPFHWRQTVTLETGAPYVPLQALSTVYLAGPVISNYPPLTDCSVSLAVCRLDMMILRLQCKRIVTQFCLVCKVHITTQSDRCDTSKPNNYKMYLVLPWCLDLSSLSLVQQEHSSFSSLIDANKVRFPLWNRSILLWEQQVTWPAGSLEPS